VNVRPSIRVPYRDTSQIVYLANPHFELVLDILAPRRQGQTVAAFKAGGCLEADPPIDLTRSGSTAVPIRRPYLATPAHGKPRELE